MTGEPRALPLDELAERPPGGMARACANCGAPLAGPYCARCGQRDLPLREPFWRVLGRFAGEQLVLDSRMGRTLRCFLLRPGFLTREHAAGRRARYSDPLRLYVLTSVLLFLAISARGALRTFSPPAESSNGASAQARVTLDRGIDDTLARWFGEDSAISRGWQRQRARFDALPPEEQAQIVADTALAKVPTAMLLLLPVFALILRLGYLRTGWLYAQHFVFVLHVHAFYYLAFLAPVLVPHWGAWLFVALAIPTYFLAAQRGAYRERGPAPWLRALMMAPLYALALVAAMVVLLLLGVLAA